MDLMARLRSAEGLPPNRAESKAARAAAESSREWALWADYAVHNLEVGLEVGGGRTPIRQP